MYKKLVFEGLAESVLFLAANVIMSIALGMKKSFSQAHLTKCFTTKPFLVSS